MHVRIEGAPSFAYMHVDLEPGESIYAESAAMASMDAALDLRAVTNGGFVSGVLKRLFGGESLFVNCFANNTSQKRRVTLVQKTPGDMQEIALANHAICLQPGAYVASTPGVRLRLKWAGFAAFLAREGLFKLVASGVGRVWFGAYGGILFRDVEGSLVVDTSHLVAYEPQLKLRTRLAGGFFASVFSGEGLVMRVEGRGKIAVQTRSLDGLRDMLNSLLY